MKAHETFWQLLKFGISGVALTLLVSLLYFLAVSLSEMPPSVALTLATILASIAGYFIHGSFSFRGFGMRDNPAARLARFMITSGIGYLLNLFFVFALVDFGGFPKWMPIIAFSTVTPLVSFMLIRRWVFG